MSDPSRTSFTRRSLLQFAGSTGVTLAAGTRPVRAEAPSGRAKRLIYLFQSGGPSQIDLFDHKPMLERLHGKDLPQSVRKGQRLTSMTASQQSFPLVRSTATFKERGKSGAWVSDLLPFTAKIADDLCFIKSMNTEQINHDPAITFSQTGFQLAGRPSLGAWISYALGTKNKDLPAYVVMASNSPHADQPLYDRLWGAGFLPSAHQGVRFRSDGDPVLYLSNPAGLSRAARRRQLDDLAALNQERLNTVHDPEIAARVAQYETAYRMQTSVPDLADISNEPQSTFNLYGEEARKPGTYAHNCLLARRLAERDVRCVQLFHRGWDSHEHLPDRHGRQCLDTDRASAALVTDLKQRGLLDDTLIVWGGEFGRTAYCQGRPGATDFGRDHHPRCYTVWLAGAGIRPGHSFGETDEFSYNVVRDPVHAHDLNATILHCLGLDHTKVTYRFLGRDYRLTDVHG